MFLLLNAFIASLDGFIIGSILRFSNIKLSKTNFLAIFLGNTLVYTFSLFIYLKFNMTFMTKTISTLLYLFLAFHSLKEEEKNYEGELKLKDYFLLTLSHSLDGTLVSLNFAYSYNIYYSVFIFSTFAILLLYIGYTFFKRIKNSNKNKYISFSLFLLLAIINYFL